MTNNEAKHSSDFARYSEVFYTEFQAAEFLKFSPKALSKWRCVGGGPKFVKVSAKAVRYRLSDLLEWAEQRIMCSTSDKKEA